MGRAELAVGGLDVIDCFKRKFFYYPSSSNSDFFSCNSPPRCAAPHAPPQHIDTPMSVAPITVNGSEKCNQKWTRSLAHATRCNLWWHITPTCQPPHPRDAQFPSELRPSLFMNKTSDDDDDDSMEGNALTKDVDEKEKLIQIAHPKQERCSCDGNNGSSFDFGEKQKFLRFNDAFCS